MSTFKEEVINKLEEYLRDRMQINDTLRLKNKKDTLTTEEVYAYYLQQEKNDYNAIKKPYSRIKLGEKVKFSQEEIDRIFGIVNQYLSKIAITEFPNSRSDDAFLVKVLAEVLKNTELSQEETEEIKKYIVSLDCLESALNYTTEISGNIYSESGRFVVQDYRWKSFIVYDANDETKNCIKDFTRVYLNEELDVIRVENKKTKETMTIFGIEKEEEIDSCISLESIEPKFYKKEEYNILSKMHIERFLTDVDCAFLKRDLYDNFTMRSIVKSINRYTCSMSEEEKEELHRIATYAAKFTLERYENDYCSQSQNKIPDNFSQANELVEGKLSREEIYDLSKKEAIFIATLRDEIKSILLDNDCARLNFDSTSNQNSIIKKATRKAGIWVAPIFEEITIANGTIWYRDKKNCKYLIYSEDENKQVLR